MKADKSTVAKIALFQSEKARFHYSEEIKEFWKHIYNNMNESELLERIYSHNNVCMESDTWLLYFVQCGGCANITTIANLNNVHKKMNPDLKIFDFAEIKGTYKSTLRTRLNELCKCGMLQKISYKSYYGIEETDFEDKVAGKEKASAIYFITKLGTTFLNAKFAMGRKVINFAPSEPIYLILGRAASSYIMSRIVNEVYDFSLGNVVEYEERIYKSRSEGIYHLDSEIKIAYEGTERPTDYVAFINGYSVYDKTAITKEEYIKSVKRKISVMFDYIRNRTKKGIARVVCTVDGRDGLLNFINLINNSGFNYTKEIAENLFFTSEACVNELGCVSGSLFQYIPEAEELKNVECFYR